MRVKASKKTILMVMIFAVILFLFITGRMVVEIAKTIDYEKDPATITRIEKDLSYTNYSSRKFSRIHKIYFTYGADCTPRHEGSARVFLPFVYHKGQLIDVYHDPEDPGKLRDRFVFEMGLVADLFLLSFIAVMFIFYGKAEQ